MWWYAIARESNVIGFVYQYVILTVKSRSLAVYVYLIQTNFNFCLEQKIYFFCFHVKLGNKVKARFYKRKNRVFCV